MRFDRVELQNVCQHVATTVEFGEGLNGIFGPNGSGKSNVLKMMRAAVLGDYRTNAGKKLDNVNKLASASAKSRIIVNVTHGDAEIEVIRGLQRAKSQMRINGGEPILGDSKIDAALLDVLGVNTKILSDYVFVMQGDIFHGIVDASDADRSRSLQALFNTGWAETCWTAVGERMRGVVVPDVAVAIDQLKLQVAEVEAEIEATAAELQGYDDLAEYDATTDPARAVVAKNVRRNQLKAEIDRAEAAVDTHAETVTSLQAEDVELQTRLRAGEAAVVKLPAAAAVATQLAEWAAYRKLAAARARHATEEARLAADAAAHWEPEEPIGYVTNPEVYRTDLATASSRRQEALDFVELFSGCDEVLCPTCKQKTPALLSVVAEKEALAVEMATEIERIDAVLVVTREHDRALRQWQDWQTRHNAAAAAHASNQVVDTGDPPATAEADLRNTQSEIAVASQLVQDLTADVAAVAAELAAARGQMLTHEETSTRLTQEREGLQLTREAFEAAQAAIADTDTRLQARTTLLAEKQASLGAQRRCVRALQAAEAEAAAAAKSRRWLEHLGVMRSALHRDALPRLVAQSYLEVLRDDINELLEMFDAPFQVDVEDGLSFLAHFNGHDQPVARLSGGQKVLFGIGFRVAVNALFAREAGLLCLDEPTEYLDEQNVGCLTMALSHLRALSEAEGMQFIVITHERTLEPLFDRVVRLPAVI
jgi:DNA repair protein SbcC/Rad50